MQIGYWITEVTNPKSYILFTVFNIENRITEVTKPKSYILVTVFNIENRISNQYPIFITFCAN